MLAERETHTHTEKGREIQTDRDGEKILYFRGTVFYIQRPPKQGSALDLISHVHIIFLSDDIPVHT